MAHAQRPHLDSELEYIDINEGIGDDYDDDDDDDAFDYEAEEPAPRHPSSTNVGSTRSAAPQPSAASSASAANTEQEKEVHRLQVEAQRKDDRIKELEMKVAQHEANRAKRQMRSAKEGTSTQAPAQALTPALAQMPAQAVHTSAQVQQAPMQATNQRGPSADTEEAPLSLVVDDTHPLAHYRSDIDNLGRRFSTTVMPFPPPPETWRYTEHPDVDPLDYDTRYPYRSTATEEFTAIVQSYAAEIYNLVPVPLQVHIPNPYFAVVFNNGIKDGRYKVLSNARGARAAIFAGLPDFNHAVFGEKSLPKALGQDPTATYWRGAVPQDIFPPIIFPPGKHMVMSDAYRSEPLARFMRLALFGSSSITATEAPQANTNGRAWGIKTITPSMVAYAVIAVRHLLSADSSFAWTGLTSGIPYEAQWCEHMVGLISSWHSPSRLETREWLDDIVFEGIPGRRTKPSTNVAAPPGVITRMDPRLFATPHAPSASDVQRNHVDDNLPRLDDNLLRTNDNLEDDPRIEDALPRAVDPIPDVYRAPITTVPRATLAPLITTTTPVAHIVPPAPVVPVAHSLEPTMPPAVAAPVRSRATSANINRNHRPSPTASALPSSSSSPSLAPAQLPIPSQPPARRTTDALTIALGQIMIDPAGASGSSLPTMTELTCDNPEPAILSPLPIRGRGRGGKRGTKRGAKSASPLPPVTDSSAETSPALGDNAGTAPAPRRVSARKAKSSGT